MKKSILSVCLCGVIIFLTPGCGESDQETPEPVKQPTAPVVQKEEVPFEQHIEKFRDTSSQGNRISQLYRMGREVPKEDQPATLAFLKDIIARSPNYYERVAALTSMYEMKSPEALAEVRRAFLFGRDRQMNMGFMDNLKRKYPTSYKSMISDWCLTELNKKDILSQYKESQILTALGIYKLVNGEKEKYIDIEKFLLSESQNITDTAYELLRKYPAEKIPFPAIEERLQERMGERKIDPGELRSFSTILVTKRPKDQRSEFTLFPDTLAWGLQHKDFRVREVTAQLCVLGWENFNSEAREIAKVTLKQLAKSDPENVEGGFPVRERAQEAIKALNL